MELTTHNITELNCGGKLTPVLSGGNYTVLTSPSIVGMYKIYTVTLLNVLKQRAILLENQWVVAYVGDFKLGGNNALHGDDFAL